jgi:NTE family protein
MTGMFRGLKAKKHLERSLGGLAFESLERQLLVIAVDIDTKERLVIRKGRISDAVHASCAMPGIIAPVVHDGRRCVDGGVVDPVPAGALRKFAEVDFVIAGSGIPTFSEIDAGLDSEFDDPLPPHRRFASALNRHLNLLAPGNVVDTFRQSIRAAQIRIAHDSTRHADLVLRPEHFSAKWHEYANFDRFIQAGRKVALERLPEIRRLLGLPTDETLEPTLVGDRVA